MTQIARDFRSEWLHDPTPFGRLEPIQTIGRDGKHLLWQCRCACGTTFTTKSCNIGRNTFSCGCLRRDTRAAHLRAVRPDNRLPGDLAVQRKLYRGYEFRASSKGLPFEVSFDQFCFLMQEPCYICKIVGSNQAHGTTFRYNGIDRLDSRRGLGYVDGNIAACCVDCNVGKGDKSLYEFYEWIDRVQAGRQ